MACRTDMPTHVDALDHLLLPLSRQGASRPVSHKFPTTPLKADTCNPRLDLSKTGEANLAFPDHIDVSQLP
ncbi:MAG: hypothetical protein ACI4WT_00910 [Oligosphaeraceae bacterium]